MHLKNKTAVIHGAGAVGGALARASFSRAWSRLALHATRQRGLIVRLWL